MIYTKAFCWNSYIKPKFEIQYLHIGEKVDLSKPFIFYISNGNKRGLISYDKSFLINDEENKIIRRHMKDDFIIKFYFYNPYNGKKIIVIGWQFDDTSGILHSRKSSPGTVQAISRENPT